MIQYNQQDAFYKVKYCNGNTEELTNDEIKTNRKLIQHYSSGRPPKPRQSPINIPTPKSTPSPSSS